MLRRYKEDIKSFIFLNEIYFFFLICFFNRIFYVLYLKVIKIDYIEK